MILENFQLTPMTFTLEIQYNQVNLDWLLRFSYYKKKNTFDYVILKNMFL